MILDARTLPAGTVLDADLCVVGGGAAGITLARDLAGTKARVMLFESGGLDFDAATQELYDGEVAGQSFTPLDVDRLRYFGGTTNHWSGGCRPFDSADFDGWPFGRDTLEGYYRRAQGICQLGPFTYAAEDWRTEQARPMRFAADSPWRSGVFQGSPPTRFGAVYRQDLAGAPNISVYLNANLVEIETTEEARQVTGLRLACLHGPQLRARARFYVIAAGGIENARLLLNSDKVQKTGLGNGNDLVGRCFMDHADVANPATFLFTGTPEEIAFYQPHEVRGQNIEGYVYAAPELLKKEGLPPFCIGFQLGTHTDKDLAKESALLIYRSVMAGHVPDHLGFYVSRMLNGAAWTVQETYRRLLHKDLPLYSTYYTSGSPPDPESRVTLIGAVDALGMRRVKLHWRLPGDFVGNMRRAHEILAQEMGRADLGRLRFHPALAGDDSTIDIQNAHHEMGTTRMHNDPKQGVVDADCRVHGIANLFIAGSSVFPTYSFDNPTMTIVALALRLSDHLKTLIA